MPSIFANKAFNRGNNNNEDNIKRVMSLGTVKVSLNE